MKLTIMILGFVLAGLSVVVMALWRTKKYHVWAVAMSYTLLAGWSAWHVIDNGVAGGAWVVAAGFVLGILSLLSLIQRYVDEKNLTEDD